MVHQYIVAILSHHFVNMILLAIPKNFSLKLYAQKSEKIQDDDDVDDDDVGTLLVAGEEDGSSKDGLGNIDGLKI
jgi:hypothetical protein